MHAEALAAIHAASFPADEQWSASALATQLALPGTFGLADPEGGFVLARVAADESEILTLAVIPALRRQGRGAALLAAAASAAAARGARALFLEVSVVNTPALALYVGSGFVEVGRRRHYYPSGTDGLVLRLDLAA